MKTLKQFIIILILFISCSELFAFTEIKDSTSDTLKYEDLIKRIDTLETELEKLRIESIDNNPYATGETLDWGTGFFFSLYASSPSFDLEIGYTWNRGFRSDSGSKPYIGKRYVRNFGLAFGVSFFDYKTVGYTDDSPNPSELDTYFSKGNLVYMKLYGGSPVLLNFIRVNSYMMWFYAHSGTNSAHGNKFSTGNGLGADIEFWLTESGCIFLGFTYRNSHESKSGDAIVPNIGSFGVGIRLY